MEQDQYASATCTECAVGYYEVFPTATPLLTNYNPRTVILMIHIVYCRPLFLWSTWYILTTQNYLFCAICNVCMLKHGCDVQPLKGQASCIPCTAGTSQVKPLYNCWIFNHGWVDIFGQSAFQVLVVQSTEWISMAISSHSCRQYTIRPSNLRCWGLGKHLH